MFDGTWDSWNFQLPSHSEPKMNHSHTPIRSRNLSAKIISIWWNCCLRPATPNEKDIHFSNFIEVLSSRAELLSSLLLFIQNWIDFDETGWIFRRIFSLRILSSTRSRIKHEQWHAHATFFFCFCFGMWSAYRIECYFIYADGCDACICLQCTRSEITAPNDMGYTLKVRRQRVFWLMETEG